MDKRLIINADGFGFTYGNNLGIRETLQYGLVKSVSVNTSFPAVEETFGLIRQYPAVSIGVHLNLQVGIPVLPPSYIPSLVRADGEFHGTDFVKRLLSGKVRYSDMLRELDAQIRVLTDRGVKLTHFDSHQNMHLYPPYFFAAVRLARAHGIERMRCHCRWIFVADAVRRKAKVRRYYLHNPMRLLTQIGARTLNAYARWRGIRMADRLISPAYADGSKKYLLDTWLDIIVQLPSGTNEIYCHPGHPDETLRRYAKYVDERAYEIEVLTSEKLKKAIQDRKIQLISFRDI
jgi:predicted glycoside hydrolase/deacetylase ChbG (UPF0249 family)